MYIKEFDFVYTSRLKRFPNKVYLIIAYVSLTFSEADFANRVSLAFVIIKLLSTIEAHHNLVNVQAMSNYPPYDPVQDDFLVGEITQWCIANGLVMLNDAEEGLSAMHAPVTTYPTKYPKEALEEALSIQTIYNKLYINLCQQKQWIENQLDDLAQLDPDFTGRLVEIYNRLKSDPNGFPQKLTGGLFRSDYLLDKNQNQIKQVEFNTVSVSFGGLSAKVGQLHDYLFKSGAYAHKPSGSLQISKSVDLLTKGLEKMHVAYGNENAAVLFVVQPNERNVVDQRLLQYGLAQSNIPAFRITLTDVEKVIKRTNNNTLIHEPSGKEISVVYYRSAYAPTDYPTEVEWKARYFLEKSTAIKCPSVLTQLSGSKKIQQLLTSVETMKEVAPTLSTGQIQSLVKSYAQIYSLDNPDSKTKNLALKESSKYVLKPQREGGGNNIYKEDIAPFLQKLPEDKWGAYILMELIEPAENTNKILRAGKIHHGGVISELGIFGTGLWEESGSEILFNDEASFLLRTKLQESNEGGVAAGFGCIDNIILD